METVQVVLDRQLLKATDAAARQFRMNRSALVRQAIRAHLKTLEARGRELADRQGYERTPDEEATVWERVTAWPDK